MVERLWLVGHGTEAVRTKAQPRQIFIPKHGQSCRLPHQSRPRYQTLHATPTAPARPYRRGSAVHTCGCWASLSGARVRWRSALIMMGAIAFLVVSPANLATVYTSSPQVIFPNGYPSMDFARELIDSYGEGATA